MKIVYFTDFDLAGSGYLNLSVPICTELVNRGHELKAVGLGYKGEEHYHPFSIIPVPNIQDGIGTIQNLYNLWGFDVLVVALDISLQEPLLNIMQPRPFKYIGIMPIEADPLCMSWAMVLMGMNKTLIISKFGTKEAIKAGINADYIQIGIDTNSWRPPTNEERQRSRQVFGLDDDTFAVLTVADNQERKNLSSAMEIFKRFNKKYPKSKYMLVTRPNSQVGWKLQDYAQEIGILNDFMVFERGILFKELWMLYASADAFMLTSKAEGLGMPLLEAMACKLPCLATNCTGMKELLENDRGYLIDVKFTYRDPFGNGRRYFVDINSGAKQLIQLKEDTETTIKHVENAHNYISSRTWDIAVDMLEKSMKEIMNE